jgi:hypothetical protein
MTIFIIFLKNVITEHAQNLPQDMWDAFNATAQRTVTGATVEAGDKKGGGGVPGEYKVASKTLREMLKVYWEVLQVIFFFEKRNAQGVLGGAAGYYYFLLNV